MYMLNFLSFKNFFKPLLEAYWASGRENSATGWFSKTGQWIPVNSYHDHPEYIHALEPELEPNYDPKKAPKHNKYEPDDLPDQDKKKDICIARGAVRVAQADLGDGPEISIQANSLYALKGTVSKLYRMFPNDMMSQPVLADVQDANGNITGSFELDEDGKLRKLRF